MMAVRLPSKEAGPVVKAMARLLGPLPPEFRQTVTFDNGTEFVRHHELHALGIETFFCDTHSPWQKGGVENGIGRLRRVLPRKTNLGEMSDERFTGLLRGITIRRASASATRAHPKYSGVKCCTSNVNPPSRLRGNDGSPHLPLPPITLILTFSPQGRRDLSLAGPAREDHERAAYGAQDRGDGEDERVAPGYVVRPCGGERP